MNASTRSNTDLDNRKVCFVDLPVNTVLNKIPYIP